MLAHSRWAVLRWTRGGAIVLLLAALAVTPAAYGSITNSSSNIGAELPSTSVAPKSVASPEPESLEASFTPPGNATVGVAVTFSGSADSPYDEDCELELDWDFGDGANASGPNPTHTYSASGPYDVTLRVSLSYSEFYDCEYSCSECVRIGNSEVDQSVAIRGAREDDARYVLVADVECPDGESDYIDCDTLTQPITVNAPTTNPPAKSPTKDNDDSDSSDDSDDSDDSDNATGRANSAPGAAEPTETPTPTPTPTDEPSDEPAITEPLPDPRPTSGRYSGPVAPVIALMILAAVIGSLGRVGGLAVASRRVALVADRDENTVQRHVAARDEEGWGDRSFTWRFPGHGLIDAASTWIPDRFARFSPLLGRITEDGSEFRAMFGSLWLATPLAGIALGLAGASAAGGQVVPASVWLLVAGAVLAAFDAFSGALAVGVFAVAALLGDAPGGPDLVHSLLVLLAIGFLWMAIPLVGSAIRPFRRLGDGSLRHRWDVTADGLIAALLCGWVAQKLVQAMDLFAGQSTGLPKHANLVALIVMGAVAVRVAMEHFSMSAYPKRLQQVEGDDPPPPLLLSSILGAFVRTAIFGFIGFAFIGSCWQLWLGIGLFLIPQLIEHIRESFPNFGVIKRVLPRGVVEIFILVVACTLAARFAMSQSPDQFTGLRLAFLLIAIPPALIGALAILAEDDDAEAKTTWPREFLGALIVIATTILATRGWDY